MAPTRADTAAASKKQARRPVPRIVPAIPHRFSRPPAAARPITPDESTSAVVTQPPLEAQQAAIEQAKDRVATPVQTPLTPESKASALNSTDVEEPALASSPARSADDHVEDAVVTRGMSCAGTNPKLHEQLCLTKFQAVHENREQENTDRSGHTSPQPEPAASTVNGDGSKPTTPANVPPVAHPAEEVTAPAPVADSFKASDQPAPVATATHRPHPSVEGLVFGGAVQESPAMPSTPQEPEPEVHPPPHQAFSAPPGYAAPGFPPQFFPGHSHHPSDTAASWLYTGYSMAPPQDAVYANGHDFHSPSYPAGSTAYPAHWQAQFSSQGVPPVLNGAARSHSQSPIKSQVEDTNLGSNYEEEPQHVSYANGFASRHHDPSHEGYDIAKHIFNLFGNPEFTDYILQIRCHDSLLFSMPIHAAIVSRSPVIFEALRRSAPPAFQTKDQRRLADVLTNDIFVTPESLHEAIKILYAGPLMPVQSFLYGLSPYDGSSDQGYSFNEARKRMSQAISYSAAGRVLQIQEMQTCGLRIAKALLRWDTVDQVIHFGFSASKTTVHPSGVGADNRIVETYAVPLLDDALEFIAYHFPTDFTLYTLAPELPQNPRLPSITEFRQPTHNPRLSKIRFGDAPPEDDLKPGYVAQTLSSILLSLPPPLLDRLFSHPAAANQVGWSGLVKIMRDVVDERERRREKVFKVQPRLDTTIPRGLLENVYRQERVEVSPDRPSGYKLIATRLADNA